MRSLRILKLKEIENFWKSKISDAGGNCVSSAAKLKILQAPKTVKNFVFDASKIVNFRMLCV